VEKSPDFKFAVWYWAGSFIWVMVFPSRLYFFLRSKVNILKPKLITTGGGVFQGNWYIKQVLTSPKYVYSFQIHW